MAISNDRIVKLEEDRLTIKYRDYSDGDKIKKMSLEAAECIRRFLLHILPDQFFKIRYYGILSARSRKTKLEKCKELLGVPVKQTDEKRLSWQELLEQVSGIDPTLCAHCKKGRLFLVEVLAPIHEVSTMTDIGSFSISIFKNPFLRGDGEVRFFSREDVNPTPVSFPKDRKTNG